MYDVKNVLDICYGLRKYKNEKIILILLNDKWNPFYNTIISNGTDCNAVLDFNKTLNIITKYNCKKCIICHNHPSSYIEPSEEDDELTKSFKDFLAKKDIELTDHIIVRNTSLEYFSYKEHNFVYDADNTKSSFSGLKLVPKI